MKKNIIINLDLNYEDDKEIFEHLQKKRNRTAFIKSLILEDIKYGNNKIEQLVKKAQLSADDDKEMSADLSSISDNEDLFESSNDLFFAPEEPEEREQQSDSSMNFLKSLGSFEDDDE